MTEPDTNPDSPLAASVEKLRQELDRWLEVAVDQGEKALDAFGLRGSDRTWTPSVDLIETPDEIRVVVDLPGVDPKTIDVALAGNMLTLKGEKPATQTEDDDVVHVRQRTTGSFSRSVPMPVPVDPDDVSAEAKEGVLRVCLKKSERSKPRQIQVKVTGNPDETSSV